jgi:hypothetical protein
LTRSRGGAGRTISAQQARAATVEERECSSGPSPFWQYRPSPSPWLRQPSRKSLRRRCSRRSPTAISATTEHFRFAADGTFTTVQANQPTSVGFWQLTDDKLDLHMVSSPAFFHDQLQPFAGQYTYYYAQALLFDIEDQAFRMVAYLGGQLRGANLGRCP